MKNSVSPPNAALTRPTRRTTNRSPIPIKSEPDQKLREVLSKTLDKCASCDRVVDWAKSELSTSLSDGDQVLLIGLIGERIKTYPGNELILRDYLSQTSSGKVKRKIYQYIAPK